MQVAGVAGALRERFAVVSSWWVTGALAVLAALLRLPALSRPREFSFDETYYAKDAFSLLRFGYERAFVDGANALLLAGRTDVFENRPEFVVHPPLGKWAIAIGEALFGMNPLGWRMVPALLGIWAVVLVHRIMLRLSGSLMTAALAGLFMAIDGLAIVLSRTALLDQMLMFFVVATFWALLRDRDQYAHTLTLREYDVPTAPWRLLRPWRLLAIALIAAAVASKWSGLWFALTFAVVALLWDLQLRRDHGLPTGQGWLGDLAWVLTAAVLGAGGYLLSWVGWFRSTAAWDRTWSAGPQWLPQALRALLHYHQEALQFHTNLTTDHPYKAAPYWWPLMLRPTSFSYDTAKVGQQGCRVSSCSAEVLALGNVVLWWLASLTMLALLGFAVARLLRIDSSAGSRIRWDIAWPLLAAVGAGWLPWIYWHNRTTFSFYSIAFAPFMFMLAAYGLNWFSGRRVVVAVEAADAPATPVSQLSRHAVSPARVSIAVVLVLAMVAFSAFFYPVWTGQQLSYDGWLSRMWLSSWI